MIIFSASACKTIDLGGQNLCHKLVTKCHQALGLKCNHETGKRRELLLHQNSSEGNLNLLDNDNKKSKIEVLAVRYCLGIDAFRGKVGRRKTDFKGL